MSINTGEIYTVREVSAETANRRVEDSPQCGGNVCEADKRGCVRKDPTALCNRKGESVIVGYDTLQKVSTSPSQPLRKQKPP